MAYYPQRARKKLDLALLLKVCPNCLGDLVIGSDFSGEYYRCLQCNTRTEPGNRIGRLPDLPAGAFATDSFPGADLASPEVLMN